MLLGEFHSKVLVSIALMWPVAFSSVGLSCEGGSEDDKMMVLLARAFYFVRTTERSA